MFSRSMIILAATFLISQTGISTAQSMPAGVKAMGGMLTDSEGHGTLYTFDKDTAPREVRL